LKKKEDNDEESYLWLGCININHENVTNILYDNHMTHLEMTSSLEKSVSNNDSSTEIIKEYPIETKDSILSSFKPICSCGDELKLMHWNDCYEGTYVCCNICKQPIKEFVYHCQQCAGNHGYDECVQCSKKQTKNFQM